LESGNDLPEFVAVGHVTHDLVNGKVRLGGAALYASVTAQRLGKRVGLVTSYGPDFQGLDALDGIPAAVVPAATTSTFRNLYGPAGRVQVIYGMADALAPDTFPPAWQACGALYLCPVLHEVPMELGDVAPGALLGVAPQGWMRTWDAEGRIRPRRWEGFQAVLRTAQFLIASEKDIEGHEDLVACFREVTPIVVITRADQGAVIHLPEKRVEMGAYPAEEVDPTGAGDCFGAAFLVRMQETGDVLEAARFASCVGSFVVEGEGIQGIPTREEVLGRMQRQSIVCREVAEKRPVAAGGARHGAGE